MRKQTDWGSFCFYTKNKEGNMARPIKETPILFGEDARRFEERMNQKRTVSQEEIDRVKKHCETVMQWFENGKKYENEQRGFQN